LDAYTRLAGSSGEEGATERLIARYGFAIPTVEALQAIAEASPQGIVEIGAGTGYWARLLGEHGADVAAYDIAPAPSPANRWFAGSEPWFPVQVGDHQVVSGHGARTLLLVWPTRDEDWPADAVTLFCAAGGARIAYVGQPPGGRTGDERFHALLGDVDRCWACAYQTPTAPCVCGVQPLYRRVRTVDLPSWPGRHDGLGLYTRDPRARVLGPAPPRPGRLRLRSPRRRP
jgi:hypothetical protein